MSQKGILGLLHRRVIKTTIHSMHGLTASFKSQEAFRCEVAALMVLVPAAFWIATGSLQLLMLLGVILIVLIVVLLNTGSDVVFDRFGL